MDYETIYQKKNLRGPSGILLISTTDRHIEQDSKGTVRQQINETDCEVLQAYLSQRFLDAADPHSVRQKALRATDLGRVGTSLSKQTATRNILSDIPQDRDSMHGKVTCSTLLSPPMSFALLREDRTDDRGYPRRSGKATTHE